MTNKEQNDRNGIFDSLKNKGKGKFMKSLVSAIVLNSTILLGFVSTTPCKAMLNENAIYDISLLQDNPPLTPQEAEYVVSSGIKDKFLLNVLAVNLNKNHSLILVSQLLPKCFITKSKKFLLNDTSELFRKLLGMTRFHAMVTCGLTWICELGKANIADAANFVKILGEKNDQNLSAYLKTNIPLVTRLLTGFKQYFDMIRSLAIEDEVLRPSEQGVLEEGASGCVTDKRTYECVCKFLDALIKKAETLEKDPNFSDFFTPPKPSSSPTTFPTPASVIDENFCTAFFNELRLLFQALSKPDISIQVRKRLLPPNAYTLDEYINHAMHTEVQLFVAKKILEVETVSPLYSTKLPCWSCVRLPGLYKRGFFALLAGLFAQEMLFYPVGIHIGPVIAVPQKKYKPATDKPATEPPFFTLTCSTPESVESASMLVIATNMNSAQPLTVLCRKNIDLLKKIKEAQIKSDPQNVLETLNGIYAINLNDLKLEFDGSNEAYSLTSKYIRNTIIPGLEGQLPDLVKELRITRYGSPTDIPSQFISELNRIKTITEAAKKTETGKTETLEAIITKINTMLPPGK